MNLNKTTFLFPCQPPISSSIMKKAPPLPALNISLISFENMIQKAVGLSRGGLFLIGSRKSSADIVFLEDTSRKTLQNEVTAMEAKVKSSVCSGNCQSLSGAFSLSRSRASGCYCPASAKTSLCIFS